MRSGQDRRASRSISLRVLRPASIQFRLAFYSPVIPSGAGRATRLGSQERSRGICFCSYWPLAPRIASLPSKSSKNTFASVQIHARKHRVKNMQFSARQARLPCKFVQIFAPSLHFLLRLPFAGRLRFPFTHSAANSESKAHKNPHTCILPPSTAITCPVTNSDFTRYATASAMSSPVPVRWSGTR